MSRKQKAPWEPKWNGTDWEVYFRVKGTRIRKRLGIRDESLKAIARRQAEKLYQDEWQRPDAEELDGTPFWKAAESYVKAGHDARFLPKLMTYFEQTAIEDIDEMAIVAAGAALYPHAQPATVRRQCRVPVTAVIRFAQGLRRQRGTDTPRTRWLTPEEAERLIEGCRSTAGRYQRTWSLLPVVAFLLGSGCRTGEALSLDVTNWKPQTRQAWIEDTKNGHPRWVRLPPRALELMGDGLPAEGKLFRSPRGKEYVIRDHGGGQIEGAFTRARIAAGLGDDVTPHVLRHTWATWYYAQTQDFGGLMDLGGWRKPDMANRYRKLAPDDLADRLLAHGWDFTLRGGGTPLRIVRSA